MTAEIEHFYIFDSSHVIGFRRTRQVVTGKEIRYFDGEIPPEIVQCGFLLYPTESTQWLALSPILIKLLAWSVGCLHTSFQVLWLHPTFK